jgi:hypothetical protein
MRQLGKPWRRWEILLKWIFKKLDVGRGNGVG